MKLPNLKSRKWKQGSMSLAITAVFIAVVVLINIVSSLLIERFDLKIDTTALQIYNISDETVEYLKDYSEKTQIIVMAKEDDFKSSSQYYAQAYEIIEKFAANSENITTEYVDLNENPEYTSKYSNVSLSVGDVLVVGENGLYTSLSQNNSDLFEVTYGYTSDYTSTEVTDILSTTEQSLVSALEYIGGTEVTKVSIITGHNEEAFTTASSSLEKSNYEFSEVSLLTEDISNDTDILVICSPAADYTEEEIAKLEEFLENGGDLGKSIIYIASATQPELPLLEAFLEDWGIEISQGSVYELDSNYYYQSGYAPVNIPETNNYTANMSSTSATLPVIYPYLKPMASIEADGITTTAIGSTTSTCVLVPADVTEDWQPTEDDLASFPYALAGVKSDGSSDDDSDEETSKKSQVIAFGSYDMFEWMAETSVSNGDLITSVFNEAANKEVGLQITSKSLLSPTLGVTTAQTNLLMVIFVILVPIAVLITGLVIWMRRRNR